MYPVVVALEGQVEVPEVAPESSLALVVVPEEGQGLPEALEGLVLVVQVPDLVPGEREVPVVLEGQAGRGRAIRPVLDQVGRQVCHLGRRHQEREVRARQS